MPIDSDASTRPSVEAWALQRLQAEDAAEPLRAALSALVEVLEQERGREHDCFLSVILRTQARRWEPLQDALLCLAAQTDQDFEVLLMLHDVAPEDEEMVRRLAESYPRDFSARLRIRTVLGGGRTRPLAAGVGEARGEYLAFFDDDDLLMANWVEAFHDTARETPGKVVRANVAAQLNRPETWTNGSAGQRSIGLAKPEYARHFNLLEHLEVNRTPFMGFAFPSSFFTFWGERFDESLPVLEDWDVALRAAGLLGVSSTPELTAIYRLWESSQTSYTTHSEGEWDEATGRVRERVQGAPFLMPANTYDDLVETVERERRMMAEVLNSTFWRATGPARRMVVRMRQMRSGRRRS